MPIEGEYVLAGTGSRSLLLASPEIRAAAVERTAKLVATRLTEKGDALIVLSGMAEGFDHLLAVTALRLGVPLWCMIPHPGYGHYYWRQNSLTGKDMFAEFCRVTDAATRKEHVAESVYVGGKHSNFVRNEAMVNAAHEFAVWDPTSRGTSHCLAAVRRANLPYVVLSEDDSVSQPTLLSVKSFDRVRS